MSEMDFNSLNKREWALCDQRGDFFSRRFGLPVSLIITKNFLRLGLSENHASLAMFLTGIAGAGFMLFGSWGILAGCLMLMLHHVMDYVDGQIARHHGKASIRGAVLDRWNHFVVESVTYPFLALGIFLQSGQLWLIWVVWGLYGWNRFRIMLAQLSANILSDELSSYPAEERQMMRTNLDLAVSKEDEPTARSAPASAHGSQRLVRAPRPVRRWLSHARVASTSFNGFTVLLATAALTDLLVRATLGITGTLEALLCLVAVYYAFNFFDYSWTYLRTNRVEKDLSSRLHNHKLPD